MTERIDHAAEASRVVKWVESGDEALEDERNQKKVSKKNRRTKPARKPGHRLEKVAQHFYDNKRVGHFWVCECGEAWRNYPTMHKAREAHAEHVKNLETCTG